MIFQSKKQERGAIMLEVIAVLALMGVMGAMLFRQIYLRNQELHNVQMASEMRTVKEAFSAALQARAQEVLSDCAGIISSLNQGEVKICGSDFSSYIKEYLPDGWFAETASGDPQGTELKNYYNFYTFVYKQADSSQKVKIYGMIIPRTETLPATGWNFKRAARVALLIGADGGVYADGITKDEDNNDAVVGSLGTWNLATTGLTFPEDDDKKKIPTYVAITGLDIFTPEYDVPEGKVNFPESWNLQLRNLNVYHQFSVGGADSCIGTIRHSNTDVDANGVSQVRNDDETLINNTCLPSFWVEADETGNVFVRNDLKVGMTAFNATPAVRISKAGAIIFKDKITDPQDDKEKSYLLDPAYTSVMNDVKLMSRGGAKLSDILPNYILKGIYHAASTSTKNYTDIPTPVCPAGYKKALLITGVSTINQRVESSTTTLKYNGAALPKIEIPESGGEVDLSKLSATTNTKITEGACFYIEYYKQGTAAVDATNTWSGYMERNDTGYWRIYVANKNENGDCKATAKPSGTGAGQESFAQPSYSVQTYCYFNKDDFENAKGALPESVRKTTTAAECTAIGGTFVSGTNECIL